MLRTNLCPRSRKRVLKSRQKKAYMQNLTTHPQVWFTIIFLVLGFTVVLLDNKYDMLKDTSTPNLKPYSWSRVQLAWWSIIVLTSFATILLCTGSAPELYQSTIVLLGISAATTATARAIDTTPQAVAAAAAIAPPTPKKPNFFLDIISDDSKPNIQRFQTLVFNITFGIYFITYVLNNLGHYSAVCSIYTGNALSACTSNPYNYIIPDIQPNNLVLLGLSSATYAVLKVTENK